MKKIILFLLGLFVLSLTACYKPSFKYEAVDPGQLKGPEGVELGTPEYRQKYVPIEKYDEPVTIDVAVCETVLESGIKPGTTPQNQSFNRLAKKYLNIDLNYVVTGNSSTYDTKLNLYMATGKIPDMFYTTDKNLYTQLLEDDQLADLSDTFWYLNDDLQENYLEYFPELLPTTMENGALYSFPAITNTYASAQRLYIRQDWLDIVNMQAPTTMEEMVAVGQAFIDNKEAIAKATGVPAKAIIPFTMNKELTWAGSYSAEGFFNCFGTSIDSYFEGEDGKLYYSNTSDATKEALKTLNHMYSEGILDKGFVSKNAEQIQAVIKSGYVGMVFGEWFMAKDVLDDCVSNIEGSNWTWVNLPSAEGVEAKPIVKTVSVGGYNLVSKKCKHPEAAARLINLFYDVYYNDNAQEIYGDDVLPSEGFYYQFVPIKLWDGIASIREYKRVQEVFDKLYEAGLNPEDHIEASLYESSTILQKVSKLEEGDYLVSTSGNDFNIINRSLIQAIENNSVWSNLFNQLRNREKTLHFADGYPYFYAYKSGIALDDMTKAQRRGWGIYHEMIDPTGGYAYVVQLTEGDKSEAKYDCFYGSPLSAMLEYSEYISKQTNVIFTEMIKGTTSIDSFQKTYVEKVFNNNGGKTIMKQVNAWYAAHDIDYDYIYALIKK